MAWINYPGGLNRTYGHPIIAGEFLYTSAADVWWVDSSYTGAAPSTVGQDEHVPMTSIAAAHTAAAAGDIIVCKDGHTETLTGSTDLDFTKQVFVCGAGRTGDVPNCTIDFQGTGSVIFTAAGTIFSNFKIGGRSTRTNDIRVSLASSNVWIEDCYFDCTENDVYSLHVGTGTYNRIVRCMIVSNGIGTGATERPGFGIYSSGAVNDLTIDSCTLDSGAYGWSGVYAITFLNYQVSRTRIINCSQLRGADIIIGTADPVTSFAAGGIQTGGAMIRTY